MLFSLEAAVWRAKRHLRVLLTDSTNLFEQFNRVVQVSHLSASEGERAGLAAVSAIYDCTNDADLVEKLDCVVSTLINDLRAWYNEAHRNELATRKTWTNPNIREHIEARWESRGDEYWIELRHGPCDYHYRTGNNCGGIGCGSVCNPNFPLAAAVTVMQSMLDRGQFLPDDAKLPMKRVN